MDSRLKRAAWRGALVGVAAAAAIASAATFNLFQPANGILKGNPSTYVTTPAASGDVIGLWSATCNNTTYLRGDGQCAAPPGSGGGTVSSVGLTMPSGFSVGGSPVTGSSVLAVTTTLSGVLKGTGSGFTTAAASDVVGLFSGCTGTDYLGADGACHVAGTVTSVALTAPSVFAVGGTPVTGAGTLAITFATGQTANEVLASPNGSSGAVSLRALVGADIPAINVAATGNGGITGSLPFASLSITSANVISLWTGTCSSSTFLRGDGSCVSPGGGGTVTSVALTAPSVFTVGGTPVTGAGTLAITFAGGQTANSFLATPNGTTGAVGLRTIVAGDLPGSITSNTSGNAATATALAAAGTDCTVNYAIGVTAGGNAICSSAIAPTMTGNWIFTPGSGTALTVNSAASNVAAAFVGVTGVQVQTWNSTTGAANSIGLGWGVGISGGAWNFFTQGTDPLIIGTNGAASLTLATNGSGRLTASSTGNIIIPAPSSGTALNVTTNPAANPGVSITSGQGSTGANVDFEIVRPAGTTKNAIGESANITLADTSGDTSSQIGQQGGQTELWQFNSGAWMQVFFTAADRGLVMTGSTGGSQGAGTINAQGLYINNVPVTAGIGQTTGTWSISYVSGCNAGTTSASGNYVIQGKLVVMNVTSATACSTGGGTLVYTALPSPIWPTHLQYIAIPTTGNTVSGISGVEISTAGVVGIGQAAIVNTGFTIGATFTYSLD